MTTKPRILATAAAGRIASAAVLDLLGKGGLSERAAAEAGIAVDVAKLPLSYLSRALTGRDTRGFIKLI